MRGLLVFLLVAFADAGAWAHDNVARRFSFERVDHGFVRLDHDTGQVAYCGPRAVGWGCQALPEDRQALESEIERLQRENAELKNKLPPPLANNPPAEKRSELGLKLPTDEDLERAMAVLEKAWRRLIEIIVNLQKDVMRKG